MREKVVNVWEQIWEKRRDEIPSISSMSLEVGNNILKWTHNLRGKNMLEAGSGTGVISAYLAKHGFKVTLLDISKSAIEISKNVFAEYKTSGDFVVGDLFKMPFENNTFTLVWNAGVLEHFKESEQVVALREMARVTRPGGAVLTFNPYSKAIFYRIGKWWAGRTGKWEFGSEFPIKSLKNQGEEAGLRMISEYPICDKDQLGFLNKYVLRGSGSLVRYTTFFIPKRLWINLFGGYLLVSVFRKERDV